MHPATTALKALAALVAVVTVSGLGITAFAVADTVSSIKPGIHLASLPGHNAQQIPTVGSISGAVNLLLTGTDTRTNQGGAFDTSAELAGSSGAGSNDVTMILHISADHQSATVVSIPRDLIVAFPACPDGNSTTPASSGDMFNTGLSRGGLSCVVLAAENLTGLSIQYAAEISFDGVIAMSNAVGGVSVCLATPVVDPYVGLNLPAGQQTLVGSTALAFVRSRHGVGDGSDLGRISNQQLFLSALLRKITTAGVLSNPITLYSLAHAAVTNMQLSDTLTSPTTLVAIALALKNVSLSNIVFLQYPAVSDPANANRVIPDVAAATILDNALVADQPVTLTGTVGRATVQNTAAPAATSTPTATSTSTAPATATPASSAVALPSSVTGQTAAEQTCTKGNN